MKNIQTKSELKIHLYKALNEVSTSQSQFVKKFNIPISTLRRVLYCGKMTQRNLVRVMTALFQDDGKIVEAVMTYDRIVHEGGSFYDK